MNPSILRALTRSYLVRFVPLAALVLVLVVAGPVGFHALFTYESGGMDPDVVRPINFQLPFLVAAGIMLMAIVIQGHQGTRRSAYVLPISTRALGTWQMASSALATGLVAAVAMSLLCWWMGIDWPIVGPSLFLASLTVVGIAIYWELLAPRFWKLCVAGAVIVGAVLWLQSRYLADGLRGPFVPWELSAVDGLVMAVAAGVAYVVGIRALERDRHGGAMGQSLDRFCETADDDLLERTTRGEIEHASADRAMGWALWARTRLVTGLGAALFSCLPLLFVVKLVWDHETTIDLEQLLAMTVVVALVAGMLTLTGLGGVAGGGREDERMPAFVATMPLTDRALGRRFVLDAAWATLLIVGIVLLISLIPIAVSVGLSGTESIRSHVDRFGVASLILHPFLCLGCCWTAAANCASIALTGRRVLAGSITSGLMAVAVATMVVVKVLLPNEMEAISMAVVLSVVGLLIVAGTILAFVVAFRRALIGPTSMILGAALWVAAAVAIANILQPWPLKVFGTAAAALVGLPLATIPLAVTWNRHR